MMTRTKRFPCSGKHLLTVSELIEKFWRLVDRHGNCDARTLAAGGNVAVPSQLADALADAGESDTASCSRAIELLNLLCIHSDTIVGNGQSDGVFFPAGRDLSVRCACMAIDIDQGLLQCPEHHKPRLV